MLRVLRFDLVNVVLNNMDGVLNFSNVVLNFIKEVWNFIFGVMDFNWLFCNLFECYFSGGF